MAQQNSLVGHTLGQYQILDEIGRGGMAVVYKAWQPTLRRFVAIKVLSAHLVGNQEHLLRFKQEAITAANLSHPNIVTVYDVDQQEGYLFIVMEYIEGRSLDQIILQDGALSLDRALYILRQVAEALDYAHQRHFIHRDIKPANILMTADGRAVLSDFGIAKALEGSGVTIGLTTAGSILGTPAYMSPEYIQEQQVDYRSDLYSLGIVCYEMLNGLPPFGGTTTAAMLYAQVNTPPPDIRQLNPAVPEHVGRVLARMLAKRPEDRFPSAGAFVDALGAGQAMVIGDETIALSHDRQPPAYPQTVPPPWQQPSPYPITPSRPQGRGRIGLLLGLLGGAVLLCGVTLALLAAAGVIIGLIGPPISGPRERIAFVSERDGHAEIYVMNSDGSGQTNLTNSPSNDYWPQWSPDNKIAFHSYEPGDVGGNAEIYVMDANGKNWIRLTHHEASDKFPGWSPDGQKIVFISDRDGDFEIYVMDSDGTRVSRLTRNPAKDYFPAWSPDGSKILFESDRDGNTEIYVMNADGGGLVKLTNNPATDTLASWSPQGNKITFTSDQSGQEEVWIMNGDGSDPVQLTTEGGKQPRWSSDGTQIVFYSKRDGNPEIYVMNSDGSGQARLTNSTAWDLDPCWSR